LTLKFPADEDFICRESRRNICLVYGHVKMTACTYTFMVSLAQLEIEPAIRLVLSLKSVVTTIRLGLVRGFEIQSLLMMIFYNKNSKHSHYQ